MNTDEFDEVPDLWMHCCAGGAVLYQNAKYQILHLGNIQVLNTKLGDKFFVIILQVLLL